MDNKIIELLSASVLEKLSEFYESGPEHEIITKRQDLAEFLTGNKRTDVSKFLALEDFPQIKDEFGTVIGWSWRAIRKWEFERSEKLGGNK